MCSDKINETNTEGLIQEDLLLWVALGLYVAFALLFLVPVVPPATMHLVEYYWAEVLLLSFVVMLFFTAATRAHDLAARRFWSLMTAAFFCWWLADVFGFLLRDESPWLFNFVKDLLLLAQGCLVVIAADLRPGVLKTATQSLQARLTAISSVVLIAGVFCYVALVPALAGIREYESPFTVYAVLDAYIAIRFIIQGSQTHSTSWRKVLLLIGVAFVLVAVADLLVVAFDSGALTYQPGQALNLVWFFFYIPLFLASRLALGPPLPMPRANVANLSNTLNPAAMMAYGVALPLIHLGGYGLDVFSDPSRTVRDLFVLAWLLVAVAALMWQYLLLRSRLNDAESAQLKALKEAAELQDQLRRGQRVDLVGQLSGGLAHEFGNSLFGAESLAQKILRDVRRPGTKINEAAATGLVNALASSRALIKKFKSLGRGDDAESAVVNVVEEVGSTIELLRSGISKEVQLTFTYDDDDLPAIARKQDLQQITLNLVLNARDAIGEHGTIDIHVGRSTQATYRCTSCGMPVSGDLVVLQVTDSGPGVDPGIRMRLFEPLVSSKPEGKGSGLGLAIVHSLVHQLQGHIVLDESLKGQCRFNILLPSIQLELAPFLDPGNQQRRTALIVEADNEIANIFRIESTLRRFRVNHVGSYEATLIFLNQGDQTPDLLVIGNLPDPVDVAAIVTEASARGIRVVMCARRTQRETLAKLRGVDAFLDQPINVDLFTSVLLKQVSLTT